MQAGAGWAVRMRTQQGAVEKLELPRGSDTTFGELLALVSVAAQVDPASLVIKAGFPPKVLLASEDVLISHLGVGNMDILVLDQQLGSGQAARDGAQTAEAASKPRRDSAKRKAPDADAERAEGAEGKGTSATTTTRSGRKTTCTSEKMAATEKELKEREAFALGKNRKTGGAAAGSPGQASAKAKRFNNVGPGRTLRDEGGSAAEGGTDVGGSAVPAAGAASASSGVGAGGEMGGARRAGRGEGGRKAAGKGGGLLSGIEASGLMSLGSEVSNLAAGQSDLASDLVSSFEPGRSSNPMRVALKKARLQQGAIEMATTREAAAMQGAYQFIEKQVGIQGNRVITILEVRWRHGNNEHSENIANFPRNAVVAILTDLLREDQPKEYRVNIKPHNMACVSPRVFWNVVRHCQVGPGKDFGAALRELLPEQDWDVLLSRNMEQHADGRYRNL